MRKPKTYAEVRPPPAAVEPALATNSDQQREAIFDLRIGAAESRRVDFTQHLGKGYDAWVWGSLDALHSKLNSGSVATRTLLSWAGSGLPRWFEFLAGNHDLAGPADLTPKKFHQFIEWLNRRYPFSNSKHSVYGQVKPILAWMCENGLVPFPPESMFPVKSFSSRRAHLQPAKALTQSETARLAQALKKDLIALHQGNFDGPDSEALTVSLLVIALRTGINATPLLEASRTCLSPNPLMPNMMVMRTLKRRGRGSQMLAMRESEAGASTSVIPMDGVAVLKGVIDRTEHLVADAPPDLKERLWIYRSKSHRSKGKLSVLTQSRLNFCAAAFARRHHLLGDDGKVMKPTVQSLRKTMEAKLWGLSGGDLIAVASAIGHTPEVADYHYLRLTDDMKADAARFIGLALPEVLRGNDQDSKITMPVSIRNTIQNTPVGRCANALHGKFAPKNGRDSCDRFTECMTCPTYVVVGSVKDLHRLFSFQEFMRVEIDYIAGPEMTEWREHRRRLVELIDHFTAAKFPASILSEAKDMAAKNPHPFWAARIKTAVNLHGDERV